MSLPITTTTSGGRAAGGPTPKPSAALPLKKRKLYMPGYTVQGQDIYPHPSPAAHLFTRKIAYPVSGVSDGVFQFSIQASKSEMLR